MYVLTSFPHAMASTHATHSIVRTAMVNVMLAVGPELAQVESLPLVQDSDGTDYLVENADEPKRCWRGAGPAEDDGTLPRDASTCLLWSAVALGALVRGCPLKNVSAIC